MALTSVLCALAMGIFLPSVKLSAIYSGFGTAPVYMIAGMTIVGGCFVSDRGSTKKSEYL